MVCLQGYCGFVAFMCIEKATRVLRINQRHHSLRTRLWYTPPAAVKNEKNRRRKTFVFAWAPPSGAQTLTTTTALSGWALTREGTSTTPREGKRGGGGCYREGDYRGGTTGMGTTGEGD